MTGLPAARQLASLSAYHSSTWIWNSGQSLPSSVTLSAQLGSVACFCGLVAQQPYVTAVFHERYCAVVFSRLPGRRGRREWHGVHGGLSPRKWVGASNAWAGERIKEEKRALEGAPSTPVDDTLINFADNRLDICQLLIEELEAPHTRVFQCSGLVRHVAQEFLRVSSYPILIVVVPQRVAETKKLKGAPECMTVDEVHIVAERAGSAAFHADNEICAA